MSWDDNWLYPDWDDKNDDGQVDSWEQSEADYEYDAVMGTNISGAFPEHDENDFDDEEDADELAEEYSDRLDLENITEVDYNGYYTSDGEYHCWETDDFLDDYDNSGFWDKCGNYHEFAKSDDADDVDDSDNPNDENNDENYSEELSSEEITEADWDGYTTSDGNFHPWEIDDMFDKADDDGFWDKCGNYHEFAISDDADDEDDSDDSDDENNYEKYSEKLSSEEITEADWDGYTTSDGNFHPWEIDDMFDEADDDGFWDKCGNYHEYFSDNDGYWENGEFIPYRNENEKYCIDGNNNRYLSAFGYWIDGNCYIENKNDSNIMGAIVGGKYYPFENTSDPVLTKVMLDAVEKLQKVQSGYQHYYGFLGYWDKDTFNLFERNNPDKVIGSVSNDTFTRKLRTGCGFRIENKTAVQEEPEFSPAKEIDSLFTKKQQFSSSPTGRMFAAAYDKFPELENYLTPKDFEEGFSVLTEKVYSKNRPLAADCWAWIVTNYADKLLDDPDFDHLTDEYFRYIPGNMSYTDDEDRHKFIQHYIAERPELTEILFSKVPYDSNDSVPFELLGWSIVRNDFAFFEKAYFMLLNNKKWVSAPPKKEDILDGALTYRESFARNQSSEKFYVFFKEEIKTVEHAGKRQHLNDILRHKLSYGFPFAKPSTEQQYSQILQNIPSIKDNVPAENVPKKSEPHKKNASAPETVQNKKVPEEKSMVSPAEKDAEIKTELNVLYERKRVLLDMIKEIDIKIEKLESFGAVEDAFFTNAEVVGMKYYDYSDGELAIGTKLTLIRDPENEYDSNAVAVYDGQNRKVGYITKRTNAPLATELDHGRKLYAKVSSNPVPDHYPNMKIEVWEEK